MRRVVFINRFYFPDEVATAQLLTDLAEKLAQEGREVAVIASRPGAITTRDNERYHGVSIHRIRTPHWGRRNLLGRIVDFAAFYAGALWRVFKITQRGDTIVAMTDPPLLGVAISAIARARKAALVHWVQDIYPEIAAELFGLRWLLALRPMRNAAWKQARFCVTPGQDMAGVVRAVGTAPDAVLVSANWAPLGLQPASAKEVASLREQWALTGKFVLGYSGNLGRVHDLEPILALAEELRHQSEFVIVFVGHGAQRAAIEAQVRKRNLNNVRFQPPQKRDRLAVSLTLPDVHLVTLRPGAEHYVFPSKLYGAASVGRPILFIGAPQSEIAMLIERHDIGRSFARNDTTAMLQWLQRLAATPEARMSMQDRARMFADGGFVRAVAVWQSLLASIERPAGVP